MLIFLKFPYSEIFCETEFFSAQYFFFRNCPFPSGTLSLLHTEFWKNNNFFSNIDLLKQWLKKTSSTLSITFTNRQLENIFTSLQ